MNVVRFHFPGRLAVVGSSCPVPAGGVLRAGILAALCTLVVAMSNSLWPAIALHALVDLAGGVMAWLALREESAKGAVAGVEYTPARPQSMLGVISNPVQAAP